MASLSITSRLKLLYLSHFSKPPADRLIYRAIKRHQPRKIVELGIGDGQRAVRMIRAATFFRAAGDIQFTGMDSFEDSGGGDRPSLDLKAAYRLLRTTGAKIQLVPGDLFDGLARSANALGQVDLLIFSAGIEPDRLAKAWFYVPRMLHENTQVYAESALAEGGHAFKLVSRSQISVMAAATQRRRAA